MASLEIIAAVIAAALIVIAAWQDFTTWKIRNWTVLALLAVYTLLALLRWLMPNYGLLEGAHGGIAASPPLYGDLAAGLLLFAIGFVLWALKLFGAGDAKLFLPVGMFVGFNFLFPFGVALAAGAVIVAVALKFPIPLHYHVWPAAARVEEIRQTGKVPYGVLIAAAALFSMWLRFIGS